ncbi:PepSY domain-containing protein [Methylosinus sp. H3A]|uniref:PepSY-associated TM helix domain-containing protein n=1 Tax=Methylosinus sp. H3A TaxID=2785786 RepID=UPI0018C31364|nr:PepSY-associated TM helix domain-containing protein [Methylosinus sp. H3A]MBG0811743.1 PepSY domain-containing protein [Methylosinus sp. H3A]
MGRNELGRKIFLATHRIIGLFAGAIVALVGLSGSMLAFREDIDEWLNAPLMRVETPARPSLRPLDEIFAAATAEMPAEGRPERITSPRHARAAAIVSYMVETDDLDSYFHQLFIDPYTAKVIGSRLYSHGDDVFSQPLVQIVMAFHWTLLLGANKAYLVGAIGVLVFFSIPMGLYLWRPRNSDWRLGLKIKWGASPERIAYDAHRSVGVYFAIPLLVMLATGIAMIFKPTTHSLAALISSVRPEPDYGKSTPIPGQEPIGLDAAVASADKVFPTGRLHWILLPSGEDGVYVVGKQSQNEPNRTKTFRNVGVDRYSGRVLQAQDREVFTAGETLLEWLFPLHCGEAFGALGRALVLLTGLAPLLLYVTGFLRWRHKRRARRPTI